MRMPPQPSTLTQKPNPPNPMDTATACIILGTLAALAWLLAAIAWLDRRIALMRWLLVACTAFGTVAVYGWWLIIFLNSLSR